jgi:chitinase
MEDNNILFLWRYLDFINVMAYDLHGSWDSATGENAPLYAGIADRTADSQTLNVVSTELPRFQ